MLNMRYKRYLDSIREVSAECQKLGIPYGEFVEVAQILLDTKRYKPEFKDKAKAFLSSMSKYASERCKVVGLNNIAELRNADPEFLQKAFRYHVTTDGKLDKKIAQFAIYCHTKLNMFSFKDMENLRKDICKRMKIDLKEDDPKYWDTLLRALPSYMQGDYPAKKPSTFEWIQLPDFTKMIPLTARYAILLKTLYPEALEAYNLTPDASDIDKEILVIGFDDTRAAMKKETTYGEFTLYSANNVYMICASDGCILYEGNDSNVFFELSRNPDPNTWVNERLSLIPKPIYFEQQQPETPPTPPAVSYGKFVENIEAYKVFMSDNSNYLLVDESGTIVYIDSDITSLRGVIGSLTDECKRTYIQNAYGEATLDEIRTFLSECASTLVHPNLPKSEIDKLFCLTPLIIKQINKI